MITKNILYKYFKDFADNHLQIKDFGYGDLWEISSSQATTYPLFWVSPQPSNISGNEISYNFNILIGDRLEDGDANKVEVESDTFQIGLDLLATLNLDRELDLDKNNTLTPFIHDFKDRIAGHLITISVSAPFDYNECAVPTTGTPQPPATSCPSAFITINGVDYGSVISGGTEDISVLDGSGNQVGSLVSGNWVVVASCPNASAVLKNTLGTTLSTTSIASGATSNITAPDSSSVLKDSAGTTISTTPIASGASSNITAPDGSAILKNTLNTTLSTTNIKSNGSSNITAPDSTITINSATFAPYPSGASSNILVKDGTGTQVGSKVGSEWIVPTGATPSGVLFKTSQPNQYTSYRSGDEGWRVQNAWHNYTPPTTPKSIAELDYASSSFFNVLKNNLIVNGVSSKTRFVDVNGGQTFSTTNNANLVVIDKLTGLMFTRTLTSAVTWDNAIDNALSHSIVVNSVTYDDWYLINKNELNDILHNYAGIASQTDVSTSVVIFPTITSVDSIWTATTYPNNTIASFVYDRATKSFAQYGKGTGGITTIYVRNAQNLITAP